MENNVVVFYILVCGGGRHQYEQKNIFNYLFCSKVVKCVISTLWVELKCKKRKEKEKNVFLSELLNILTAQYLLMWGQKSSCWKTLVLFISAQ